MSDFIEDLGREIDRAAAARVAGRRPKRVWPRVAALSAAAAAVAVAIVVAFGHAPERAVTPPPAGTAPATNALAPPPPDLRDMKLTVANGSSKPGFARSYAERLEAAGWDVTEVTNAPYPLPLPIGDDAVVLDKGDPAGSVADALDLEAVSSGTWDRWPPRGVAVIVAGQLPVVPDVVGLRLSAARCELRGLGVDVYADGVRRGESHPRRCSTRFAVFPDPKVLRQARWTDGRVALRTECFNVPCR